MEADPVRRKHGYVEVPVVIEVPRLPEVISNPLYLQFNSLGRAILGIQNPSLMKEWNEALQAYVNKNGKFTKAEVIYLPVAPPAILWEYPCATCIAFQRETLTCKWVSEKGYPNLNIIHPQGWCVVWMPLEDDKPFSYIGKTPWFIREPMPQFP